MWSYKLHVDSLVDVLGKIGCSFRRRPIPFLTFLLFFCLDGIEIVVSGLMLN